MVPGQVIGERYLIGSVIGEGGMGVVCAATHVGLGTPVAIKLIRPDLKHDAESVVRFLNEARTAAALKGEHIARVYDVGQLETGEPYLVMEQLEGVSLDSFLAERGALPQTEAVDIVLQACDGLAEAHAVNLVHRDVKPANLFLARRPDGQFVLKILDFGISKRLMDGAFKGVTNPGRSMGSPWYMSPEQMMNPAAVDQRADVWSLGVMLYELLTNEYPFNGEGVVQVCANVLVAPAPRPSSRRGDIDARLDEVVLRCLEKRAEDRFQSVDELAEALRPFSSRTLQTPSNLALTEPLPLAATPEPVFTATQVKPAREKLGASSHDTNRACVREIATVESFAPVSAHPRPHRPRWSVAAAAAVSLVIGAFLSWLGWPYLHGYYEASQLEWAERVTLPWDPVLAAGPEPAPLDRELPAPVFVSAVEQPPRPASEETASAPSVTPAPPSSGVPAPPPAAAPTSNLTAHVSSARSAPETGDSDAPATAGTFSEEEIQRRVQQYEQWLADEGLSRIDGAATGNADPTPTPSAAPTVPIPAPAPAPPQDLSPNPYDDDEEP